MKKRKAVILVGAGGHAKVVIDAVKNSKDFTIYGTVDSKLRKGLNAFSIKVVGSDSDLAAIFKKGIRYAFIAIGSIGDCSIRKRIYGDLKRIGFKLPVIVHPKTVIAKSVELGEGTFVAAGATINPDVKIGKNVIINTSSSIDHDCIIGDFVHIAPGAILSGGVSVGEETHIGTGANIIQYIKIGKKCLIGAGQTVIADIADKNRVTKPYA